MKKLSFKNAFDSWILILIFFSSAVLLYAVEVFLGAIFFLILGLILVYCSFEKCDSLLKIEVNNLQITFFYMENKKRYSKTFSFDELKEINLEISRMVDYNRSPLSKSRDPIDLSFKITNLNEELFIYNLRLPEFLNITKVFDLLKNVPNFKYKVVTNSDAFGVMVDKSAQQKQNISIKQSFDIMMKDPKVPQSTKNFIKLAIIGLIIHIIVLVPLIILLIIDIIKMYVHN